MVSAKNSRPVSIDPTTNKYENIGTQNLIVKNPLGFV
jgi:hypothetical protein